MIEMRYLPPGVLEISKTSHPTVSKDEGYGWVEGRTYLTLEEVEEIQRKMDDILVQLKGLRVQGRQEEIRLLQEKLDKLKRG